MKRDWNLIRKILLELEKSADFDAQLDANLFSGYDPELVSYHFKILRDAQLIEAENVSSFDGVRYIAKQLTWDGQQLLDNIRSNDVWNKVKSTIKNKGLPLSLDVIKAVATKLILDISSR